MFDPYKMTYEECRDRVLYLCDGKDKTCSSCGDTEFCMSMCKHTWNIAHAKNLIPIEKDSRFYRPIKLMKFEPIENELIDEYGHQIPWSGVWEVEDD